MSGIACIGKRRYESEPEAWSVIFKMRARGQDTERLIPKRCEFCRRWHLGRVPSPLHPQPKEQACS